LCGEVDEGEFNNDADIRNEVYYDNKKLSENCPEETDELGHGSGFIIGDHLLITNKHVIQDALDDKTKEIRISNNVVDELPCEVVHCDPRTDLAILYCKDLNLKQNEICPLKLCGEDPLPGQSIFTFGFPFTYSGKTALFVKGYVSGSQEVYGRPTLMVLNCPVNHGNSGGPVLCWIKGQLNVVGVLVQKHKKHIVTIEEKNMIEAMRLSLQKSSLADLQNPQTAFNFLTLKLYDALEETHCQFNLCNAVPGSIVSKYIDPFIHASKYDAECK